MENQDLEFGFRPDEYFSTSKPPKKPSRKAKKKKMLMAPMLAASVTVAAVATFATLLVRVDCTLLSVSDNAAKIEATLWNRPDDETVAWILNPYQANVSEDETEWFENAVGENWGTLETDVSKIDLMDLEAETRYSLLFYSIDREENVDFISNYDFKTKKASPVVAPTALQPQTVNYKAPYYIEGVGEESATYFEGSYEIEFSFALNGMTLKEISLVGSATENEHYATTDTPQSTPIDVTLPASDVQVADDIATVRYLAEDVYATYEITPTIYFERTTADGATVTDSRRGELYRSSYTFLYSEEMRSENLLTAEVDGDIVRARLEVRDFSQGTFEFRVEQVFIEYGGQTVTVGGEGGDEAVLPMPQNGVIVYEFEVPKSQDVESMEIRVDMTGDCYLNGEKMELESSTYAATEVIWGTAYSIAAASFDEGLTINGLSVQSVTFSSGSGAINRESIDKVLPGREVMVDILLVGSATKEFYMTADIAFNETKITAYDLTYTQDVFVSEGEEEVCVTFYFTMPNDDVTAEDIAINGFTEVII